MTTLIVQSHTLPIDITIPKFLTLMKKTTVYHILIKVSFVIKKSAYLLNILPPTPSTEILIEVTKVTYKEWFELNSLVQSILTRTLSNTITLQYLHSTHTRI
jgi:hypothetical protein